MKILILEDDKFDSDLAKRHIKKQIKDSRIDIATSIEEAKELIHNDYDVALLDIKLPDGYGTDFLIQLRRLNKTMIVIMLSGSEDEEFIVTALKSGADDYIVKKDDYLLHLADNILLNLNKKDSRIDQTIESLNVLYLEHHTSDIDLTIRHFKKVAPQFNFSSTPSSEHAIELLNKSQLKTEAFDILLMDYKLPGNNALDVTKKIRQEYKMDIPIIIVTGQGNEDVAIQALKLGADDYLVKRENYLNKLSYLLINAYHNRLLKIQRKELVESESNYRRLFEKNPQPMWIYDVETLKFLNVNTAATTLYGFSKKEFLNMTLKDIRPEEDVASFLISLESRSQNPVFSAEWIHQIKSGEKISVEITSHTTHFKQREARHVLINDITHKKEIENQLRLLSASVEQSHVSVLITNVNGEIEYVNPKFAKTTGYTKSELIGKNPRIVKSGVQDTEFYTHLWDTIQSGQIWTGEICNKKKNEQLYWENVIISPIKTKSGEISHFVSIKEDITDKKHLIDELIIAKEKAEESDHLKSAFLASMSHEIRTPLNAIVGFSNLIAENNSDPKFKSYSEIVSKQNDLLLQMMNDIIEFAKVESQTITVNNDTFDLNEEIENIYLVHSVKCNGEVKLIRETPVEPLIINSDKYKINQIFSNLISNAIKFTKSGSISFGYELINKNIRFFVKDTGIGIEKDKQKHIFKRFIKLDEFSQGVGLGLSIVENIVKIMNGRVWLNSETGKGSVFYFTFPIEGELSGDKESDQSLMAPIATKTGLGLSNFTLLVAEDDESNFLVIKELLGDSNLMVIHAKNGKEAVDICKDNLTIDIVLMDIKMPLMDGHEATKQIKKLNPGLPIIAQTAYALPDDKEKAARAGFDAYITKPINKKELLETIHKIIG